MPQRSAGLVLALVGVAAVGVLLAFGANLSEAASRGPRWRRRLLAAGLAILAAVGSQARAGEKGPTVAPAATDPAATLTEAWQKTSVPTLRRLGQRLQPIMMSMQMQDVRLLPDPDRTLTLARIDLATAADPRFQNSLSEKDRAAAKVLAASADGLIEWAEKEAADLKRMPAAVKPVMAAELAGKNLEDTAAWKTLETGWAEAQRAVAGGSGRFYAPYKEALRGNMDTLAANARAMESAKLLSKAEADLLCDGLAALSDDVRMLPTKGVQPAMGTCYVIMPLGTTKRDVSEMEARTAMLKKLEASGRLRPAVVRKALFGIQHALEDVRTSWTKPEDMLPEYRKAVADLEGEVKKVEASLPKP